MKFCCLTKIILLSLILAGCERSPDEQYVEDAPIPIARQESDEPETTSEATPSDDKPDESSRSKVVTIENVKFTVPGHWKQVEPESSFISARFMLPTDEQDVQLTVSTAGGGIEANFTRWKGQFQLTPGIEPIRQAITLTEGEAHWLDLRGTFTASTGISGSTPERETRMIGVGIPLPNDPGHAMYLKLLGPESAVAQLTDEMREFVKSADLP